MNWAAFIRLLFYGPSRLTGTLITSARLRRGGSPYIASKLDVTTPLQTFALIITAEPHFLMKVPSRMVVLENIPPQRPGNSQVETVSVQYIGNSSDYFRDPRVPEIATSDYRDIPVSLLGARQAVNLARFAGAQQDAPQELEQAEADLLAAEKALRFNQPAAEVDVLARKATSSGAKAEEMAFTSRAPLACVAKTFNAVTKLCAPPKKLRRLAQQEIEQLRGAPGSRATRARVSQNATRQPPTSNCANNGSKSRACATNCRRCASEGEAAKSEPGPPRRRAPRRTEHA